MSNILDLSRGLGIEFGPEEKAVAALREALAEAEAERSGLENEGADTTLHDIVIERIEQQLRTAIAKLKSKR